MSAQLGRGVELGRVARELVVDFGQHLFFDFFDVDRERQLTLLIGIGMRRIEAEVVAGFAAEQVLIDLGHHGALAHLVEVVVGGQTGDRLVFVRAFDVDGHVIAFDDLTIDGLEVRVLVAQPIELGIDLFVAGGGIGDLDPQGLIARHPHLRAYFDDRVEAHRTRLLPRGDVDLGRRDDIDVVFDHRLGVIDRKGLTQRFLSADVDTEPGFEHLARRLARSEPRQANLLGKAFERGVDFTLELSGIDLYAELDLVRLYGFDGRSHRPLSVSAPMGGLVTNGLIARASGAPATLVQLCGCSSMVELQPSKLAMRVRFPSPALARIPCSGAVSLFNAILNGGSVEAVVPTACPKQTTTRAFMHSGVAARVDGRYRGSRRCRGD